MTSENQSFLRFSVEESVWFQKGQEVSELVSISLDPNIVIQEHEQYVSIRGALQLTGEYRIDENTSDQDERDFTSVRVVNEVTTREDGVSELSHDFPVDITIPKNRIQNLDDVYVAIESFDYELPKRGCLQLVADLSISGIYGSQQSVPSVEDAREEAEPIELNYPPPAVPTEEVSEPLVEPTAKVTPEVITQEEEQELAFAARTSSEEDAVPAPEVTFGSQESPEKEEVSARSLVEEDESSDEVEMVNMDLYAVPNHDLEKPEEDLYTPFEVEARKEVYYENEEEVEEEASDVVTPIEVVQEPEAEEEEEKEAVAQVEVTTEVEVEVAPQPKLQVGFKGRPEEKYRFGASSKNSTSAVEERSEEGEEAAVKSENALYLTKIFARDDEEDFTKMKICIAQYNDSLEAISERYEVSIQALVRVNQLSDPNHVSEGQLLYIPVSR
ncbi:stage VI sporulation protein D [Litchfieldia alkalitelluris]|uniref:stage VI sporulation protein D n=1 Tax=Litchfieldia alkalitelluris TaxID=304268 RepID=UPI0009989B1B|nr:stage VI sporulation protein D [Litchfieldia alkalitelluris]